MRGGFYQIFCIYLALITAGVACGLGGCKTVSPALTTATEDKAFLTVVNQTDYIWTLVLRRGDNTVLTTTVNPRESSPVYVVAGRYDIEQGVVGSVRDAYLTQVVSFEFKAGQRYRWPLVTLLSEPVSALP